jgi:hypothetical protein
MGIQQFLLLALLHLSRSFRRDGRLHARRRPEGLGALVGGEIVCQALGFWRYPPDDTGRGPLLIYPLLTLVVRIISVASRTAEPIACDNLVRATSPFVTWVH